MRPVHQLRPNAPIPAIKLQLSQNLPIWSFHHLSSNTTINILPLPLSPFLLTLILFRVEVTITRTTRIVIIQLFFCICEIRRRDDVVALVLVDFDGVEELLADGSNGGIDQLGGG